MSDEFQDVCTLEAGESRNLNGSLTNGLDFVLKYVFRYEKCTGHEVS